MKDLESKIKDFEEIFSEDAVKEMRQMVKFRLNTGIKKNSALDLIAVANGFKDYKTAKGLRDKLFQKKRRYWTKVDEYGEDADEDFDLFKSMRKEEKEAFLEKHKKDSVCELVYMYENVILSGRAYLSEHCFTKEDVQKIITDNGGVLLAYDVEDVNGMPYFTFMLPKEVSEKAYLKICREAYRYGDEEQDDDFDFDYTVENYVNYLKRRNAW